MCGIAGKLSSAEPIDPVLMERMSRMLEHRGPDSRGSFLDDGVGLAVQRLAVQSRKLHELGGDQVELLRRGIPRQQIGVLPCQRSPPLSIGSGLSLHSYRLLGALPYRLDDHSLPDRRHWVRISQFVACEGE